MADDSELDPPPIATPLPATEKARIIADIKAVRGSAERMGRMEERLDGHEKLCTERYENLDKAIRAVNSNMNRMLYPLLFVVVVMALAVFGKEWVISIMAQRAHFQ